MLAVTKVMQSSRRATAMMKRMVKVRLTRKERVVQRVWAMVRKMKMKMKKTTCVQHGRFEKTDRGRK